MSDIDPTRAANWVDALRRRKLLQWGLGYQTASGNAGVLTIGYACALTLDDARVAQAVQALRGDAGLLPALRKQIAVYTVEIGNLDYTLEGTGLNALIVRARGH